MRMHFHAHDSTHDLSSCVYSCDTHTHTKNNARRTSILYETPSDIKSSTDFHTKKFTCMYHMHYILSLCSVIHSKTVSRRALSSIISGTNFFFPREAEHACRSLTMHCSMRASSRMYGEGGTFPLLVHASVARKAMHMLLISGEMLPRGDGSCDDIMETWDDWRLLGWGRFGWPADEPNSKGEKCFRRFFFLDSLLYCSLFELLFVLLVSRIRHDLQWECELRICDRDSSDLTPFPKW